MIITERFTYNLIVKSARVRMDDIFQCKTTDGYIVSVHIPHARLWSFVQQSPLDVYFHAWWCRFYFPTIPYNQLKVWNEAAQGPMQHTFEKLLATSWNCHDKTIDLKYSNTLRKMWPKILRVSNCQHVTSDNWPKLCLMCIESKLWRVHSPLFPPNCLFDNTLTDIYNQLNH